MNIKINDNDFSKKELLSLIIRSKLEAIKHIKSITNIGLKDAKEIVDSLDDNPNCYDGIVITKKVIGFSASENSAIKMRNRVEEDSNKKGTHFIKNRNIINKPLIIGFILIAIFLIIFYG